MRKPEKRTMANVYCPLCGSPMKRATLPESYLTNMVIALITFAVGVALLFLFPLGTIVGILFIILALVSGGKRRNIWKCTNCDHILDRA
jgi:rubredoxin